VLLALGLDLEKRDERPHLLLDRLETGQRIELRLERRERQRRLRLAECVGERLRQPLGRLAAGREALADHAEPAGDVVQWIPRHFEAGYPSRECG